MNIDKIVSDDNLNGLVFVDCEANGPCPGIGELTEFGAVTYPSRVSFHGVLYGLRPSVNPGLNNKLGDKRDPVEVFTKFDN